MLILMPVKITSLKLLTDKLLDHQIHCVVIKAKREPDHPIETTQKLKLTDRGSEYYVLHTYGGEKKTELMKNFT